MQPIIPYPILDDSLSILARTPSALDALLRDLPGELTHVNEGEKTWSAFDVVGHLIYADREDWLPRIRRVLESGESRPFDPFDRNGHVKESQGKSLGRLLDEFAQVRREKLDELRALSLQPADFECRGRHPALGAVTISELVATWAAHDLNHIHQIARILAHQSRSAVGPFAAFLGVLHCNGHGA